MVGRGGAAAEHVGLAELDPRIVGQKLANGRGSQLSVGVGRLARDRINGVVARANLIALENRLARARDPAGPSLTRLVGLSIQRGATDESAWRTADGWPRLDGA